MNAHEEDASDIDAGDAELRTDHILQNHLDGVRSKLKLGVINQYIRAMIRKGHYGVVIPWSDIGVDDKDELTKAAVEMDLRKRQYTCGHKIVRDSEGFVSRFDLTVSWGH